MTIVEKIKALLAKAASTDSPHEAEIFLAKAKELMTKHQLDAEDLETDDPINKTMASKANGGAAPDWDFQLMWAVAAYYGCESIQWKTYKGEGVNTKVGQYQMWIVGRESARVTAVEMWSYLVKTVRRLGRENAESMGLNPTQAARRIGRALQIRIRELTPPRETLESERSEASENALITLDRVLTVFNEMFPNSKKTKSTIHTNNTATKLAAGIGLNHQMGGSSSVKRLA